MALSEIQKARIRDHLGYPQVAIAGRISLGFPTSTHTEFLLEHAFQNVLPEGEILAEEYLCRCNKVLEAIDASVLNLSVSKVGSTSLRGPEEIDTLRDLYRTWCIKLADVFGVVALPQRGASGPVIESC